MAGPHLEGLDVAAGTAAPPHSWFIGFAPATAPQLAIAVIVENGGAGSQAAAPVALQVLRKVLAK